jgi:hypothetical protein
MMMMTIPVCATPDAVFLFFYFYFLFTQLHHGCCTVEHRESSQIAELHNYGIAWHYTSQIVINLITMEKIYLTW